MSKKLAVIVGRFQSPFLTEGHENLFREVILKNKVDGIAVFIGSSKLDGKTNRNPLSFNYRKCIIKRCLLYIKSILLLKKSPKLHFLEIKDVYNLDIWSKNLDSQIKKIKGYDKITLYGSRDSFPYNGSFEKKDIQAEENISATEVRESINKEILNEDFQKGIVYCLNNQFPTVIPTVDIVITNLEQTKVLLAQKTNQTSWRIVGGFADPNSEDYEEDAIRELFEETNITVKEEDLRYLGNINIDDPRYNKTKNKIRTSVFQVSIKEGTKFKAQDDIQKLKWFKTKKLPEIEKLHNPIIERLLWNGII